MANIKNICLKENGEWREYSSLYLDASKLKESKRGVSFITEEGQERLYKDEMKGFCHHRFKANFVVGAMDIKGLTAGMELQIGDVVVRIIKVGKECLLECPIIAASNPSCFVNREAFFGELIQEGLVKKEDTIQILD